MIGALPLTGPITDANRAVRTWAGAKYVQVSVFNAAIYLELGRGIGGVRWEDGAQFLVPGVYVIPGPLDATRVRSAAVHAGTADDPWPFYALNAY